ncbi:MAG: hypothetical protein FJ144_20425 [Deltaproteobacteria bacterium]|nr:hypothetical protein [Deltaproteobacteria bacterium]
MKRLPKWNRVASALGLLFAVAAFPMAPASWGVDNPRPGPTIDVDCTDPESKTLCRECHIDGPVFCCPGDGDPCTIKSPSPKVSPSLSVRPRRPTFRQNLYFTR